MKLGSWGRDLLDLLLPRGCAACRSWLPGGPGDLLVCGRCRSRLRVASWPRCPRCHHPLGARRPKSPDCIECRSWPPALTAARYAYVLEAPATDLVHALKYEGYRDLAEPMGAALARLDTTPVSAERTAATEEIVVPVPTTTHRLRMRGYNQAELLARRVAAARGLDLVPAVVRRGEGPSQTSLTPDERRRNVQGAFAAAVEAERLVRGAHAILVDDVLTTGATAGEAAVVLAELGAARVTLLAFARALPAAPRKAA